MIVILMITILLYLQNCQKYMDMIKKQILMKKNKIEYAKIFFNKLQKMLSNVIIKYKNKTNKDELYNLINS